MTRGIFTIIVGMVVVGTVLSDRKQDALFGEYGSLGSKADFYSEEYLNGKPR